ncbi:MAG: hypothetical protein LBL61_00035, partial [Elusimicrobiota bacterium]|nr:hypothetical protein [Elusimicrobiota bacterium]
RSIILTLTQNGKPLIKDFVYQECAPSEISITSVKLSDDYIIMGKKLIFLNDAKSLPITNENFSKLEDFFD